MKPPMVIELQPGDVLILPPITQPIIIRTVWKRK